MWGDIKVIESARLQFDHDQIAAFCCVHLIWRFVLFGRVAHPGAPGPAFVRWPRHPRCMSDGWHIGVAAATIRRYVPCILSNRGPSGIRSPIDGL